MTDTTSTETTTEDEYRNVNVAISLYDTNGGHVTMKPVLLGMKPALLIEADEDAVQVSISAPFNPEHREEVMDSAASMLHMVADWISEASTQGEWKMSPGAGHGCGAEDPDEPPVGTAFTDEDLDVWLRRERGWFLHSRGGEAADDPVSWHVVSSHCGPLVPSTRKDLAACGVTVMDPPSPSYTILEVEPGRWEWEVLDAEGHTLAYGVESTHDAAERCATDQFPPG